MFNIKKITIDLASRLPIINRLFNKKTAKKFVANAPIIVHQIRAIVDKWIDDNETIKSLRGGILQAEFGLTDNMAEEVIEEIKTIWTKSIKYRVSATGAASSLLIFFGPRSSDRFLSINNASYISTRSQEQINWLRWLLLEGDSIKIIGWRTMYKPAPTSRSGQAIMVKTKTKFWSIPEPFNKPEHENFMNVILNNPAFRSEVRGVIQRALL